MNIVFMGTPDFARESLKAIYEAGHNILGVVTNVDRPRGRGMKLQPSEVKEYALEKGLTIYQPERVKKNQECHYSFAFLCVMAPNIIHMIDYSFPSLLVSSFSASQLSPKSCGNESRAPVCPQPSLPCVPG